MSLKIVLLGWFAFVAAPGLALWAAPNSAKTPVPKKMVRVLLADSQPEFRVTVLGPYRLSLLPSGKVVQKGPSLKWVKVSPAPKGIQVGADLWSAAGIRITPLGPNGAFFLNGVEYRGGVDIVKEGGLLWAINRLDVESYLYGVLPHEVAAWWPMEALKAQSVASRTYALYQAKASQAAPFDLRSTTSSQVYRGSADERYRSTQAVKKTRNQVLRYGGKIFPAYFHATCAGKTAGAHELWKIHLAPVAGLVDCDFCRISPHYFWQVNIPLAEIENLASQAGRPIGHVLKIEAITQTPSHRVGSLRLVGTAGEAVVAAKDFRVWVGGDRLKSTSFRVEVREDAAEFYGKGWGHGVGLCQWGALGQALLGKNYKSILKFYYPGSEISDRKS